MWILLFGLSVSWFLWFFLLPTILVNKNVYIIRLLRAKNWPKCLNTMCSGAQNNLCHWVREKFNGVVLTEWAEQIIKELSRHVMLRLTCETRQSGAVEYDVQVVKRCGRICEYSNATSKQFGRARNNRRRSNPVFTPELYTSNCRRRDRGSGVDR